LHYRYIKILAAASPYELVFDAATSSDAGMIAVYLRGHAYLALREGAPAAAEFRKILQHPSIGLDAFVGILPHLGLARACALPGDVTQGRESYQDFLALWKDADPDIPILKQAKAEYERLPKGGRP
jgi:eukaryotic-like serine/threonine-protein kinase